MLFSRISFVFSRFHMSICFVDDVLYITYNISFKALTKRVTHSDVLLLYL